MNQTRLRILGITPVSVALLLVSTATIAATGPVGSRARCLGKECQVSLSDTADLRIDSTTPASGRTGELGAGAAARPPKLTYVPSCFGGGSEQSTDTPCNAAAQPCPEPSDTRFWVYIQAWSATRGAYGPPVLRTEPPYTCLGPAEVAEVNATSAVVAQVRKDWKTFGLPPAVVVTQPKGETLVNVATRFTTTTPLTARLPPRPVLGMDVTLRIKAERYEWDFGDGTVQKADAEGGKPRAEHTYRDPGVKRVRLRAFYSATFTIAGDATVYPLEGTADVPGRATRVTAREARTELIDG